MNEQSTDQQLIDRVLSGDKDAFNLLVIRYQNRLAHLVSNYVRSSEVPDVVQEAFIKAYRSLDTFKGESLFYTWLYRIATNTAKNYLQAMGRRPPARDIDVYESETETGFSPLKEDETPENLLLADEMKKVVFEAIETLSPELKQAILLREIEGKSYDEIAQMLDIPVGTVRSRLFRARDIIDDKLKEFM